MTIPDDFPKVRLSAPDGACADVFLHGGHVASWQTPDGQERLFFSQRAQFGPGAALRGGVPVIFPQFAGHGPLLKHGFARTVTWQHLRDETGHFWLEDSINTRAIWDHAFRLDLRVTVGGPRLRLALDVTNTGPQPFEFTAALHTYLRVDDIATVSVEGLEGLAYREHGVDGVQTETPLRITGEVDRIYWQVPGPVTVTKAAQHVQVSAEGFPDVVVWNPGPDKGATLPDLEPDDYRHMLCIEAAAIGHPVVLAPGAVWRGAQVITIR
jgi:glucose-6-phosphate 1-epimerase